MEGKLSTHMALPQVPRGKVMADMAMVGAPHCLNPPRPTS